MRSHRLLIIYTLLLIPLIALTQTVRELMSPNEQPNGNFGFSVAGVGDVNGDGYGEILIGAKGESPWGSPGGRGRVYVINGRFGWVIRVLDSPNELEFLRNGWFGYSISGAGDVNNDGIEDIIVGARMEMGQNYLDCSGRAYVFGGARGDLIYSLVSPNEQSYGYFGNSVSGAGDVNGDGYDDFMVGAPLESNDGILSNGNAYVFSGIDGDLIHTLTAPGQEEVEGFGIAMSNIGDVNGDGYDDVTVSTEDAVSADSSSKAYVFSGYDGSLIHTLVYPDSTVPFSLGTNLSVLDDVDGDGINEILLGVCGISADVCGRILVFNGASGALIRTIFPPATVRTFGYSLSGTEDVNGDGYADIVAGNPYDDPETYPEDAGRIHLFSGSDGTLIHTSISPNPGEGGFFGCSVSGAIEMNGNPAILIGACYEDPGPSPANAGRAYIIENPLSSDNPISEVLFVLDGPYPNPVSRMHRFELSTRSKFSGGITLRLFDICGREVTEPMHQRTGSRGKIVFQPGNLDLIPGVYQWCLETGTSSARATMVVVP